MSDKSYQRQRDCPRIDPRDSNSEEKNSRSPTFEYKSNQNDQISVDPLNLGNINNVNNGLTNISSSTAEGHTICRYSTGLIESEIHHIYFDAPYEEPHVSNVEAGSALVRVVYINVDNVPYGYFSWKDVKRMLQSNIFAADITTVMPLDEALQRGGKIVEDFTMIISSSDGNFNSSPTVENRILFPGNSKWNHWKQYYLDFVSISSSNEAPVSTDDKQLFIVSLKNRILINPKTREVYKSSEMNEPISYLKHEYKVREFLGDAALKSFIRFLLNTFSAEIKRRLDLAGCVVTSGSHAKNQEST